MSVSRIIFAAAVAALFSSCCAAPPAHGERRFEISYYDRNGDGIADFEHHRLPGMADADWKLEDSDYDRRYDKLTKMGYSVTVEETDQPVPENVKFSEFTPASP